MFKETIKKKVRLKLSKVFKSVGIITTLLTLSACSDHPQLTQFKAFDERFNTVIDTTDADKLSTLSELFYDRRQTDDLTADLGFKYLFDITTSEGTERWSCTTNGYCKERVEGFVSSIEIFYLERYKELYALSNLD